MVVIYIVKMAELSLVDFWPMHCPKKYLSMVSEQ